MVRVSHPITRTFAEDIEQELGEELLDAIVVISEFDGYHFDQKFVPGNKIAGRPLPWIVAREALNYEYRGGFGAQDCHNINIFTPDKVYYIHEYDGSTSLYYVPRNPPRHDLGDLEC